MNSVLLLIKEKIQSVLKQLYEINVENVFLEHPDNPKWGDYSTNVALKLAKDLNQSPEEIAKNIVYELQGMSMTFSLEDTEYKIFESVDFAPPGFINFTLSSEWLKNVLYFVQKDSSDYGKNEIYKDRKIMIEYTDPNPFKVFHVGHLMSNCIGESLSRIFEFSGGEVKRANYQGDVGMHVAKSVWGMQKKLSDEGVSLEELEEQSLDERLEFLGQSYAMGATVSEQDPQVLEEIKQINLQIFQVAQEYLKDTEGWDPKVNYAQYIKEGERPPEYDTVRSLYLKGRAWSLEGFENMYSRLGTAFDYYYFESVSGEIGYLTVQDGLKKGVFEKEEGAVIFRGEKYGLHTRVFINSLGLPTYEAKDLGLAVKKYEDYPYDFAVIVTGNEIADYFKVVLKALEILRPELSSKIKHIPHGMMRLPSGKMSSRTGDVVTGVSLLDDVHQAVAGMMEEYDAKIADQISVGALKYDILKQGIGKNIVFDREKSLSIIGNTGPYLQYTHARASSLLEKSTYEHSFDIDLEKGSFMDLPMEEIEIELLRKVPLFPEVVARAMGELAPGYICTYLFDLAQSFNRFYDELPVLNADSELTRDFRLLITDCVSVILKSGLWLLGIEAPDQV